MKDNICGMMAEALNKKDMTSAKAKFDTNGKICLLLNEKRQKGEKIESGEMTIRIKPVTMTVSMKGQYEGTETISTPADEFDCVKVNLLYESEVFYVFG